MHKGVFYKKLVFRICSGSSVYKIGNARPWCPSLFPVRTLWSGISFCRWTSSFVFYENVGLLLLRQQEYADFIEQPYGKRDEQ